MLALLQKKRALVLLALVLLLTVWFVSRINNTILVPAQPRSFRYAKEVGVFSASARNVLPPTNTPLSKSNYRKALNEICALMDRSEQERIVLANAYLEKPEKPEKLPDGRDWHGEVVRQVAISPATPTDVANYTTLLSYYNLSDEDQQKIDKQITERYFGFKWEYRLVEGRTPIDIIGNENPTEIEINVTDTTHILDGDEDDASKFSAGGNTSSISLSCGSPHLSYSALFNAAQLHLMKK